MTAPRENHWAHLMVAIGLLVTAFGTLASAQVQPGPGRLSFIALAASSFWYGWVARSRSKEPKP